MAKPKLSPRAVEILILFSERSEIADDGVCWVPNYRAQRSASDWSATLGRFLSILGSGDAAAIKGLWRKGLAKPGFTHLNPYASRITEEGRLLVEHWRETNSWPIAIDEQRTKTYPSSR